MTYQRQSPLEGLLVAKQFSFLHVVSLPAQCLCVRFEFPEAIDGLSGIGEACG